LQRALKIKDLNQIETMACNLEHHLTPETTQKFKEINGIDDISKNVDNFILENRMPTHISTLAIFPEIRIIAILMNLKKDLSIDLTQSMTQHLFRKKLRILLRS